MVEAFEGNKAETQDDDADDHRVHGRPPARRRHGGRRCRDGVRGEPARDRGRRAVVHPRRPDPRRPLRGRSSGAQAHPGNEIPDGHVFTQPWPAGPTDNRRDQVIYYQYRADRARRTLRGIDEQVAKAEKAVAGKAPVKRNRFITLTGGTKTVNRDLETKARALAGIKGYVTNIANPDARVRDRRLPPALAHREVVPDVQARPARPADLPPQTRIDRGPPDHRVRRARGHPPRRGTAPAGPSRSSSAPPAATAPSTSAPADTSSPPKTHSPPTYATPSP